MALIRTRLGERTGLVLMQAVGEKSTRLLPGLVDLHTTHDLLKKLAFDLGRMKQVVNDQYAAFDFIATAECMLGWTHSGKVGDAETRSLQNSNALLRITPHLTNDAKQSVTEARHHASIACIEKQRYVELDYCEEGYFEVPVNVRLKDREAAELGYDKIKAFELARVLKGFGKRL